MYTSTALDTKASEEPLRKAEQLKADDNQNVGYCFYNRWQDLKELRKLEENQRTRNEEIKERIICKEQCELQLYFYN